ncbi:MAG: hypothetical protein IJ590_00805 [Rickettsiales bacterium]|nr:hypothetical protein [Rickettsiales bacterium]
MQGNAFDSSRLIVSWNRYEQSLMKQHLMKCAYSKNPYCFGDKREVCELHKALCKHGIIKANYNYQNGQINYNQLRCLVNEINNSITQSLRFYNQNDAKYEKRIKWNQYDIKSSDDYKETKFLTSFAMAVQDTKIRGTFIPQSTQLYNHPTIKNMMCARYYKFDQTGNCHYCKYVTFEKAKLLTLATQLTRVGLNCKTTVHNSMNIRGPTQNSGTQYTINFIDTNNFLGTGVLAMDRLGIGMNGVDYYKNLYRKLFDFALRRATSQCNKGICKCPCFFIPLTHFWGQKDKDGIINVNRYMRQALDSILNAQYNKDYKYKDLIVVDVIDYNLENSKLFNQNNWKHGKILSRATPTDLFNDNRYDEYAIGAGDHYAFIGNECMECWKGCAASSQEAFAMKTDFPRFYSSKNHGFAKNGYWQLNKNDLNMPTQYQLYLNYHDKIINIDEQNKYKQIQNFAKYGQQMNKNRMNNITK